MELYGIDATGYCKEGSLKMGRESLVQMAGVDIRTVDITELTDLRNVKPDASLPVDKKLAVFAGQVRNVYVNRIGDYVVKVRFQEDGATIDDKMSDYLRRLSGNYLGMVGK